MSHEPWILLLPVPFFKGTDHVVPGLDRDLAPNHKEKQAFDRDLAPKLKENQPFEKDLAPKHRENYGFHTRGP